MKLAIIAQYLNQMAGIEKIVFSYLKKFLEHPKTEKIHLFCSECSPEIYQEYQNKIEFHFVRTLRINPFLEIISFFINTSWQIKKTNFDLYWSHFPLFVINKNYVSHIHSVHKKAIFEIEKNKGVFGKIKYQLRKWYPLPIILEKLNLSFLKNKHFIVVSPKVKREIMEIYKVPEERIAVIPPIIDLTDYELSKKESWKKEIQEKFPFLLKSKAKWLGIVTNRLTGKNVDLILKALSKIESKNIKLLIIGRFKTSAEKKIRKWIKKFNLKERVYLTGGQKEIQKFYSVIDLFLFPSSYESFGLSLVEALAMSTISITSKNVGVVELIPPQFKNKIIFELDKLSPQDLVKLISLVLEKEPQEIKIFQEFREWIDYLNKNSFKRLEEIIFKNQK